MGKTLKDGIEQLRAIGGWIDGRPPTFREQMIDRYGSWEEYERESEAPSTRKPMTDAELIAALRRKPYDRAAREAADRLEELTRKGR